MALGNRMLPRQRGPTSTATRSLSTMSEIAITAQRRISVRVGKHERSGFVKSQDWTSILIIGVHRGSRTLLSAFNLPMRSHFVFPSKRAKPSVKRILHYAVFTGNTRSFTLWLTSVMLFAYAATIDTKTSIFTTRWLLRRKRARDSANTLKP